MAAPFIFVPEESSSTPYNATYHNAYYATPPGYSPFLPPSPLLYPSSPYLAPLELNSGSPDAFNPNNILWPDDAAPYESAYTAGWIPLAPRQRTNSWHGPKAPAFLSPGYPSSSSWKPGHKKKASSWGHAPAWATSGGYLQPQQPQEVHPWLNGDAPSPTFHLDLAPRAFLPLRLVRAHPPQSAPLNAADFREPAFHPPRTALRILHPRLPFWPVDLALPAGAPAAPISLGDVLAALHRALHTRITPADWEPLGRADAEAVTRAFTHRCRAEAVRSGVPPAQLRDREIAERNEGVKRVDFLLGKTVFKGLVRTPGDPEGVVRLVTA
ncbi:hypothetical protein DFH09DRAFT_153681 [Mycena vulgaris]|nr:hypothetical protein DFH09DRAFT_153681 [Mycena vulgaris]